MINKTCLEVYSMRENEFCMLFHARWISHNSSQNPALVTSDSGGIVVRKIHLTWKHHTNCIHVSYQLLLSFYLDTWNTFNTTHCDHEELFRKTTQSINQSINQSIFQFASFNTFTIISIFKRCDTFISYVILSHILRYLLC